VARPRVTDVTDLLSLGSEVDWPDHAAAEVVRDRVADMAGLGQLAELAEWVSGVRPPSAQQRFTRIRAVVFGAVSERSLAADTAAAVGADLLIVDDLPAEANKALLVGAKLVDSEVDSGADLLIVAVPGLGSDSEIAVSVLTNTEPVKVLTRGAAATDPEAWMSLAIEVRDGRRRCMPLRDRPDEFLDALTSPPLAAAAGFLLRAAGRRTPVMLDGPAAAAAALIAYEAAPRAVRWWCAADLGPDPVHELALTRLGKRAILGLGTGLGDGLAALLAVPVLQVAVRLAA
jgi:NaMN:DMB phosphoribosyltransferase